MERDKARRSGKARAGRRLEAGKGHPPVPQGPRLGEDAREGCQPYEGLTQKLYRYSQSHTCLDLHLCV